MIRASGFPVPLRGIRTPLLGDPIVSRFAFEVAFFLQPDIHLLCVKPNIPPQVSC